MSRKISDILLFILGIGTILCCAFASTGTSGSHGNTFQEREQTVVPSFAILRNGDLIFRDGKSFISKALKKFNLKDQRFSHAGILHLEAGEAYVYHCIGGEGNPDNRLRKEKLSSFCRPSEINRYSIFRTILNPDQLKQVDSLAGVYHSLGIEFDTGFDLSDSRKMYCTEMIYNIFETVLKNDNFITLTNVSGMKYVACDDIFLSPDLKEIYIHSYNPSKISR
jgi:hypothetical protein